MKLTIQQARGGGLTSLICIRDALDLFKTFPWGQIVHYLPADCEKYMAAAQLVGNNSFFGFNSDLGVVKSTNYKSLAYVAMKLLIKNGGPNIKGLTKYRGITSNPLFKDKLDELINQYDPVVEIGEYNPANPQTVEAITRLREAAAANQAL